MRFYKLFLLGLTVFVVAHFNLVAQYNYDEDDDEEYAKKEDIKFTRTDEFYDPFTVSAFYSITLPVGTFGQSWGTGYGGLLSFEFKPIREIGVGLISGYQYWEPLNLDAGYEKMIYYIPVNVFVYYYFAKATGFWPYFGVEAGMNFLTNSYKFGSDQTSISETRFSFAPTGGIITNFIKPFLFTGAIKYNFIVGMQNNLPIYNSNIDTYKSNAKEILAQVISFNFGLCYRF